MSTAAPRHGTTHIPAGALASLEWGEPADVPVIAVHGWHDNAASFAELAPRLADRHVIAIDLPGHGRSFHRPPGSSYWFFDYVLDVVDVLDARGIERSLLLGHSLGGGIVAAIAAVAPERVRAVVLLDGFSPALARADRLAARVRRLLARRRAMARSEQRSFATVDDAARRLMATLALPIEAARLLAARGTRPHRGRYVWSADPRLALGPPMGLGRAHLAELLASIRAPTLFVRARDGLALPPDLLALLDARVRRLARCEVPGGHHVHLTDPVPVAREIRAFLAAAVPA